MFPRPHASVRVITPVGELSTMEECTGVQHVYAYGEALGMLTQNLLQPRRGLKLILDTK